MPLRILNHVYWRAKKQFMLESDVYRNWTMFAVEEGRFAYEIGESRGKRASGIWSSVRPGSTFIDEPWSP
ncbi:hypothetical protein N6H14_02650 [Paenibacillus sp. CC-CFT747]|nr:hypothetical protein N6H14_02650 [Paenibacillus sp. CC-CFT747]